VSAAEVDDAVLSSSWLPVEACASLAAWSLILSLQISKGEASLGFDKKIIMTTYTYICPKSFTFPKPFTFFQLSIATKILSKQDHNESFKS
jgi:hypothetical protein